MNVIAHGGNSNPDMLCRNGCGFYGSAEWQGNCSRCWTGMTASEKLEAMAATQQIQLPQNEPSSTQDVTEVRRIRTLQKNPRHICMYCGQKFTGDVSRYRAHLWNHQQKFRKFWYHAKTDPNKGTGIARPRRKYYKKRPNMYIFLWQDPSKSQSLEKQDSLSWDTNESEDSFDDGGNLKCRFCDALFTNENQLVQHEKFHSTQRPYACSICGQSFKIRGHLARHEIIHQRNEKHCCDFCNATFAKTSQLKVHRVIHLAGDNQEEPLPTQVEALEREPKHISKVTHQKHKKVRPLKIVLAHKFKKAKVEEEEEEEPAEKEEIYDTEVLQSVDIDYIQKKAIEMRSAAGAGKVCQYCSKRCASARDLMEHERKHTGEKPHRCPICSMKTARKSDLTKHMRTMHPTVHCLRCSVCDALFTSQDKLEIHSKIHIETEPSPPSTFTDDFTSFNNMDESELQVYPLELTKDSSISHMQKPPVQVTELEEKPRTPVRSASTSQSKAPLACQYCPRVYTIRRDLIEHERTHTGEKPYACTKCPQRFHRKSNYFRHRQICKGIPPPNRMATQLFGCFYCEEMFPNQQSLMKHQRAHTPAKTGFTAIPQDTEETELKRELKKGLDRLFPCKFCNKRFLNRAGLVVHEKSHKGTYSFKCRHCGRRFLTKSGLVTHENMHLKNKSRIVKAEINQTSMATDNADVKSSMEMSKQVEKDVSSTVDNAGQAFEDFSSPQAYLLPSCDVKVNEKVQAYKCRYCSKVCGKYANLLVHEKLHTHGNRYKCKKCGKGFDVRRRLRQHENTHKEYICQICTKSFLRHLQLIRHVKSAHKNASLLSPVSIESSHSEKYKPGKRGLLCMYCGHRFCRKNKRLLSHMRSHRKRYGKYWYIKAANVLPVISYTNPEIQTTDQSQVDKPLPVIPHGSSGPFKCRFCDKVCSRKMYLEQHEVIHTANRRFQCNTCGLKFCKLYQLTRHKKKAHKGTKTVPRIFHKDESIDEEEDYQAFEDNFTEDMMDLSQDGDRNHVCHFCNAVCDTRENLLSHEKSHGSEGELTYTCKFCPMIFFRRTEYERHERTHTGEKPYVCNICNKAFNRTWNLKIHRINVHGVKSSRFRIDKEENSDVKPPPQIEQNTMQAKSEGPYQDRLNCKFCGKHLMSEWSLKVHERTHTQEDLLHCRVCGMAFNRTGNLNKHLQTVHKGRIDAKTCNLCQKEFANPSNLRKHLKQVHMIKNPFVSKYSLPTDLPDAKDDTNPPPPPPPPVGLIKTQNLYSLKCDKCGKRFRDTFGLRKHKMTICGGGRRQCHICKQAFSNSSNLNRHIISHTGQKPFKCDICQRGFFQSTHLTRHMSLHSGKRPFACNLCKSNFSSQALLDHHKLSHTAHGKGSKLEKSVRSSLLANDRLATQGDSGSTMTLKKETGATPLTSIKGYKCSYCEATFIDQAQLRLHERAHLLELPFRCQICFKLFETNAILEKHEKEHNTAVSGKVKADKEATSQREPQKMATGLSRQVSEEVDRKPQICGYCSKPFANSNELRQHIFLVHNVNSNAENKEIAVTVKEERKPAGSGEAGKVYPCVLCRKNFSSSSNRSRHFRIFHKGKKSLPALKPTPPPVAVTPTPPSSTKRYFCQPCNRSYSSSGNLSKHRRIHHGQKPKVRIPASPFQKPKVNVQTQSSKNSVQNASQTQNSKSVVQVIDGIKKYFCLWCSKSFSNSGNLSRHKRLFHNKKPTMGNILGNLLHGKQASGRANDAKKSSATSHQPKLTVHAQKSSTLPQHLGLSLKTAVSSRSKGGKFACNMCDRTFTQSTNLSRHKRNFHGVKPKVPFPLEKPAVPKKKKEADTGGVKFGCLYCHEMFSLKSALIEHQATHTTKSLFMCQHCDMTFSESSSLIAHEKDHMEADRSMECRFCGQTFTNRGGLTMHERSHKGEKRYQCRHCFKTFFNKAGLMSHERCHTGENSHGNEEESPQRHSSSSSSDSSSSNQEVPNIATSLVKTHESTLDQTRPHGCDWCDKRFLTTTDLKRHIRTHTGEQPYPCPLCPKKFSQSQNLKKHLFVIHKQGMPLASWNLSDTQIQSVNSMPVLTPENDIPEKVGQQGYKCRFCSKVCSALRYLAQHEKVHMGGAPQSSKVKKNLPVKMNFKVSKDRDQGFEDNGTRQSTSGMRDSNGHGKRHQCDMCPKSFGSSGDLVRHIRTHTGEKPYECPICLKQFSRNHHLKLHQESVHAAEAFVTPTEPEEEMSDEMYPELPIHIKAEPISDEEENASMEYPSLDSYPDPAADEGSNHQANSNFEDNHEDGLTFNEESSYAKEHEESMEEENEGPPVLPHYLETAESFEEEEMDIEGKQCRFCTKSFITIHDLRRHEITHTGKEQYMCGVCNTTFSNEDNLISHSLIHSK